MENKPQTAPHATLADLTAEDILNLSNENLIKLCDQNEPDWRDKAVALKMRINKLLQKHGHYEQ